MDTSQTSPRRTDSVALAATAASATELPIETLHRLARDLAAPLELPDFMQKALSTAVQLTGAHHATLLLLDATGEQICYRVALDNGNLAPLELVAKPMMRKGLAGWVVRAKCTALVDDTEQDQRWLPGPGLGDLRSALVAPLISAGHVLGVLTLGSEAVGHFRSEHVALIEIVAAQVAGTILHTRAGACDAGPADRSALAAVPAMAPPRAQDTAALAAELRGLSAASARLSPEICFEEILNVYIHTMAGIIQHSRGMMVHNAGDTLLAVFVSNGGGVQAAARAAIAMQTTVQQLAADWQRRFSVSLGMLNIGIAQGQALLDRMLPHQTTCRAVGPVITQAMRLRELARSSEILVADEIYTALSGVQTFELTALPPLHLGAAVTQNIYRLEGRHMGEIGS